MEYGSDFHYCTDPQFRSDHYIDSWLLSDDVVLTFSGRTALYAILQYHIFNRGLQKIALPSYYCHEVTNSLTDLDIEIEYYNCNPFDNLVPHFEDRAGFAVVNVDYFGLFKMDLSHYHNLLVIDDLTHNLLSVKTSEADYCFGSLRKELPVPVGGFIFSPKKLPLPEVFTSALSADVAVSKLTAMELKRSYRLQHISEKHVFRNIFSASEELLTHVGGSTAMPGVAVNVLEFLMIDKILEQKRTNIGVAVNLLDAHKRIIMNPDGSGFGLMLKFKSTKKRDQVRTNLISKNVYPAVLWPNQFLKNDIEHSNTLLFIHMDFRYGNDDVVHIVSIINNILENE